MERAIKSLGALVAFLGLAACDGGIGPDADTDLSLSFAVQPAAGLAGLAAGGQMAEAANSLALDAVVLNLEELTLEHEDGDGGADSDGDSEEDSDSDGAANEKFAVEGSTVELPVNGGIITPFTEPVPAGLYEEVEMDLVSVRFAGTADGESFDVTVPLDLELEMEFEPSLEVLAGEPVNVTITVDPFVWLENEDGTFIDPRDLLTDDELRHEVRHRIALSFKAFEDSDHDADEEDSDSDTDGG